MSSLGEIDFPRFVQIETVRACNSRCPFCPFGAGEIPAGGLMADSLYEKIEKEVIAHALEIVRVTPHLLGEPLLDPKMASRIAKLKRNGIREVALSTNAELLDEAPARALLEAGIDILKMSISAVVPEKYKELRVGLDFDRVMANARRYFRLRDEINPAAQIVVTCERHDVLTDGDIAEWVRLWRSLMAPRDMLKISDLYNQSTLDSEVVPGRPPCEALFQTLYVFFDGTAPLCCHDIIDGKSHAPVGDAVVDSLAAIWRGERFRKYRELHRKGMRDAMRICNGCTIWEADSKKMLGKAEKI